MARGWQKSSEESHAQKSLNKAFEINIVIWMNWFKWIKVKNVFSSNRLKISILLVTNVRRNDCTLIRKMVTHYFSFYWQQWKTSSSVYPENGRSQVRDAYIHFVFWIKVSMNGSFDHKNVKKKNKKIDFVTCHNWLNSKN